MLKVASVARGVILTGAALKATTEENRAEIVACSIRLDSPSRRPSLQWWLSCFPTTALMLTARRFSSTDGANFR
jgi:hypothetical protein